MENKLSIRKMTTYSIGESDKGTYITPLFNEIGRYIKVDQEYNRLYLKDMEESKIPDLKLIADAIKRTKEDCSSVSSVLIDHSYNVWVPYYKLHSAILESKQKKIKIDTIYKMCENNGRYFLFEIRNHFCIYLDEIYIDPKNDNMVQMKRELDALKNKNIRNIRLYIDHTYKVWVHEQVPIPESDAEDTLKELYKVNDSIQKELSHTSHEITDDDLEEVEKLNKMLTKLGMGDTQGRCIR